MQYQNGPKLNHFTLHLFGIISQKLVTSLSTHNDTLPENPIENSICLSNLATGSKCI